jgi:hypothetical protein
MVVVFNKESPFFFLLIFTRVVLFFSIYVEKKRKYLGEIWIQKHVCDDGCDDDVFCDDNDVSVEQNTFYK